MNLFIVIHSCFFMIYNILKGENMKKIVVCSTSKPKNNAVENVIKDFVEDYEIISLNTNSKVSETPMSHEEGIEGCINRINDAKSQIEDADLYIAMEGILNIVNGETFLCGWTIIYDSFNDKYYYGCSSQVHVPKEIIKDFNQNTRLSDIVATYYNKTEEEIRNYGTNGMLTNGCYTRTQEFTDSVLCAISSGYERILKH